MKPGLGSSTSVGRQSSIETKTNSVPVTHATGGQRGRGLCTLGRWLHTCISPIHKCELMRPIVKCCEYLRIQNDRRTRGRRMCLLVHLHRRDVGHGHVRSRGRRTVGQSRVGQSPSFLRFLADVGVGVLFRAPAAVWNILDSTRVCLVPITPRKRVLHVRYRSIAARIRVWEEAVPWPESAAPRGTAWSSGRSERSRGARGAMEVATLT